MTNELPVNKQIGDYFTNIT